MDQKIDYTKAEFFWCRWMLWSTIGLAIMMLISRLLVRRLDGLGDVWIAAYYGLTFLSVGVFQFLILRHYIPNARSWILANGAAGAIATPALYYAITITDIPGYVIVSASLGLLLGVSQWMVLRMSIRQYRPWMLASTTGWLFALLVSSFISWVTRRYVIQNEFSGTVASIIQEMARWMIYFAIIGYVLGRIMRRDLVNSVEIHSGHNSFEHDG